MKDIYRMKIRKREYVEWMGREGEGSGTKSSADLFSTLTYSMVDI